MPQSPHSPHLQTKTESQIGWLTINRPDLRNAINNEMWRALPTLINDLGTNPEVRVIVIRGSGGHFVSGADISEFDKLRADPTLAKSYDEGAIETLEALANLAVPSIAMIEGACVGGGCLIALGCDIRVVAHNARLGIPAAKIGLAYPYQALEQLVATVGQAEALALTLTGELIDGKDAVRRGLGQYGAEPNEILARTTKIAADIASNAPIALTYLRRAIRRSLPAAESRETISKLADACYQSDDYQEGIRAFLEKRKTRFTGR